MFFVSNGIFPPHLFVLDKAIGVTNHFPIVDFYTHSWQEQKKGQVERSGVVLE